VGRWQERRPAEERHAFSDAGDRAIGEHAEDAAAPEDAGDPERGVSLDEAQAHAGPCAIDRAGELGGLVLDRERDLVAVGRDDLATHRDRPDVRAGQDHPVAPRGRGDEQLPSIGDDGPADHLVVEARKAEDLDVVPYLLDERLPDEGLPVPPLRNDDREVLAHRGSRARRRAIGDRPAHRCDRELER